MLGTEGKMVDLILGNIAREHNYVAIIYQRWHTVSLRISQKPEMMGCFTLARLRFQAKSELSQ